jgi:large subunit ribosomal protein L3
MEEEKKTQENKEKTLVGKKVSMSQVFTLEGKVVPVTRIKVVDGLDTGMVDKSVKITGKSKGKGFAGVMKKWGFAGGPATRGQSDNARAAGSIGAQTPGRVFKGKKMAGRMGNKKVTVKGLKIVTVDLNANELLVSGPVPGARNSEVLIRFAE